jgi:hypothetical protein
MISSYEYWFSVAHTSVNSSLNKNVQQLLDLLRSQQSDVSVYIDAFNTLDRGVKNFPPMALTSPNQNPKESER